MNNFWGRKHMRHAAQTGFTLIEVLIVVSILGILLALAAPSFIDIIKNQRIKSLSTDIQLALVQARSEAVKRNSNVTLAPNTANDWTSGWTITDANSPGTNIEVHESFTRLAVAGPASVVYQSSGRISGATAPTFDISATGAASAHQCVTVDLSGRPAVKATAC